MSLVDGQPSCGPRTQVLACADALSAGGAEAKLTDAVDDAGIDAVLQADNPIVVAADSDSQIRAVLRRAVRIAAPAPSARGTDLPDDRTVADLPPLGVLPLAQTPELVPALGLPDTPETVANAVLAKTVKRTDLLRNDGGGVTVHGIRLGGGDRPWRGKIALDDAILTDGTESLIVGVVANADGYGTIDGLPLCDPDPTDAKLNIAIATPVAKRGLFRRKTHIEVRRGAGRAVAITPVDDVPFIEDGITGELGRKRTWWMERAAAGWYVDVNNP